MYPFDNTAPRVPTVEATVLAGLLRGGTVQTAEDVRCVNCVVDYVSFTILGVGNAPAPGSLRGSPRMSKEAAAQFLETFARSAGHAAAPMGAGVWQQILVTVLENVVPLVIQFLQGS